MVSRYWFGGKGGMCVSRFLCDVATYIPLLVRKWQPFIYVVAKSRDCSVTAYTLAHNYSTGTYESKHHLIGEKRIYPFLCLSHAPPYTPLKWWVWVFFFSKIRNFALFFFSSNENSFSIQSDVLQQQLMGLLGNEATSTVTSSRQSMTSSPHSSMTSSSLALPQGPPSITRVLLLGKNKELLARVMFVLSYFLRSSGMTLCTCAHTQRKNTHLLQAIAFFLKLVFPFSLFFQIVS